MKKTFLILFGLFIISSASFYFYAHTLKNTPAETPQVSDPLNISYTIDSESFTLVNGLAENEIVSGSATKNKLSIFGTPSYGDLDGDGDDDAVLLLMNEPGGSGTFFYTAIAVNVNGTYKSTDSILLGDRISPQNFYIKNNKAEIDYVVRADTDDFSTQPSIGKSLILKIDTDGLQLIQVAVDFEGEANPDVMTLNMKPWTWIQTLNTDGSITKPKVKDKFTITFDDTNTVGITTDCNSMSATYQTSGNKITFGNMTSTLMFCQDSQEQIFATMLADTESFSFTSKGELILELKSGEAAVTLR